MKVRAARLDDVSAICRAHLSAVPRWTRFQEDGKGEEVRYEELTLFQRWLHGGPHMSPELCAVHLNHLLLAGQTAWVAEDENGRVVGEIEVLEGEERDLGRTAHVSVLNVDAPARRMGAGRALVEAVEARARANGCAWLTTRPADDAVPFYERLGISKRLRRPMEVEIDLEHPLPEPPEASEIVSPLDGYRPLSIRHMVLGCTQSPFQNWQLRRWTLAGIDEDRGAEEGYLPDLDAYYRLERAIGNPPGRREGGAFAWVGDRACGPLVLAWLAGKASSSGYARLRTAIAQEDLAWLEAFEVTERSPFLILGKPLTT